MAIITCFVITEEGLWIPTKKLASLTRIMLLYSGKTLQCCNILVCEFMIYAISLSVSYHCNTSGTITISCTSAVFKPLMLLKMHISHG